MATEGLHDRMGTIIRTSVITVLTMMITMMITMIICIFSSLKGVILLRLISFMRRMMILVVILIHLSLPGGSYDQTVKSSSRSILIQER